MVVIILVSCGGARRSPAAGSPTVAVVGGNVITKREVRHWMTALSLSGARKRSLRSDESPLQQTVSFLITSRWMIGEARQRKLGVEGEVDSALRGQENAYTTRSEFTGLLKESGRTVADLRLELEAELAFAALRRMLASSGEDRATASIPRARERFLARWTSKWKALTDCRAGYVVDSCKQHPGSVTIEYPISVDL
jgi:hypothetical protein